MAPIRTALIGLSGAPPSNYEGTNWAANAHLPYLMASPHYTIVALLNSTAASARAAIERYGLPESTRAYGDPNGECLFRCGGGGRGRD
jgi:predicted dehydrogenase